MASESNMSVVKTVDDGEFFIANILLWTFD